MTFLWTELLAALLLVPLARRPLRSGRGAGDGRRPRATRACRCSAPRARRGARWRRHLPFALLAAGVAATGVRARPAGRGAQRAREPDDDPARDGRVGEHVRRRHRPDPAAGRRRTRPSAFVDEPCPTAPRSGSSAFSSLAAIIQQPTDDQDALLDAIESLHDRPRHRDRQRHPHLDRRDRGSRPERRAGRASTAGPGCRREPVLPGRLLARDHRRSSPTAPTTPASSRSTPRSRPPIAASGCTRSGSGPTTAAQIDAVLPAAADRQRAGPGGGGFGGGGFGFGGGGGFRRGIDEDTLRRSPT